LASRHPSTTHAISQPAAGPIIGWLPASREAMIPTGTAQASVQATVRHGTNQRPSEPA